ncbi:MAG: hypothetical protein ACU836_19030 [Gammaproteobacteria bacterium]
MNITVIQKSIALFNVVKLSAITLILTGCVGVTVVDSPYDKNIIYWGAKISETADPGNYQYQNYRLRASKDKRTGALVCCLIQAKLSGMMGGRSYVNYYSANFIGGEQVDLIHMDDSQVRSSDPSFLGGGHYMQIVGVPISYSYLEQHAESGFTVRLNEQSGRSNILEFSSRYLKSFLDAIGHNENNANSGNNLSSTKNSPAAATESKAETQPPQPPASSDLKAKPAMEEPSYKVENVDKQSHKVSIASTDGVKLESGFEGTDLNAATTISLPDGTKFTGKTKNGKLAGKGTILSPDGTKILVNFVDGQPDGNATVLFADGQKATMRFKNGKLIQ